MLYIPTAFRLCLARGIAGLGKIVDRKPLRLEHSTHLYHANSLKGQTKSLPVRIVSGL